MRLDWQMSTDTYMTIHTALCLSHCAIKLKMYAEPNWKCFQNESCYQKSNANHMYPTYSFPYLVKRIRVSWFCRSPGTKTSRNWSQVLAMHEAVTISIEASPESSHFPVAWPGLTPEGRRSACVKQSSGTRRQGQGSGNQETSTAASPTPRHPSSPEQPRLARAGCSCEHARPDLGWRPAHPRHNPKFLSRPEPWEGADRYHVSHAKVV